MTRIMEIRQWLALLIGGRTVVPHESLVATTALLDGERDQNAAHLKNINDWKVSYRGLLQHVATLSDRLGRIHTIITRRPPRRRWLALCRRIADLSRMPVEEKAA